MTETIPKPPPPSSLADIPLNEEEQQLLAKENEELEEDSETYIHILTHTDTHVTQLQARGRNWI